MSLTNARRIVISAFVFGVGSIVIYALGGFSGDRPTQLPAATELVGVGCIGFLAGSVFGALDQFAKRRSAYEVLRWSLSFSLACGLFVASDWVIGKRVPFLQVLAAFAMGGLIGLGFGVFVHAIKPKKPAS